MGDNTFSFYDYKNREEIRHEEYDKVENSKYENLM